MLVILENKTNNVKDKKNWEKWYLNECMFEKEERCKQKGII